MVGLKISKRDYVVYKMLLVALFLSTEVVANEENIVPGESGDFSMEVAIISRTHELEFLDSSLENSVILRPNTPYILRAKLFTGEHELMIETDNISDIGVDDKKGKSSYTDIKYSGFFKENKYSAYYGEYKGFHVSGQRDTSGNFFVFDDIRTKRYGFEFISYKSEPKMLSVNNRFSVNI